MCGEELHELLHTGKDGEIPPRVRRRASRTASHWQRWGNTSACAEKSECAHGIGVIARKYLRVCGEEFYQKQYMGRDPEIPPRVRRRDGVGGFVGGEVGNTSACAEKSASFRIP